MRHLCTWMMCEGLCGTKELPVGESKSQVCKDEEKIYTQWRIYSVMRVKG